MVILLLAGVKGHTRETSDGIKGSKVPGASPTSTPLQSKPPLKEVVCS